MENQLVIVKEKYNIDVELKELICKYNEIINISKEKKYRLNINSILIISIFIIRILVI